MRSYQVVPGQNANAQSFTLLRDDARASSFLLAQQMLGYFTLSTNPSNTQTLTLDINGNNVVFTFVSSSVGTTPGNVLIGASAAATVANLLSLLQQPQTTTATGVALSAADMQFVSYLSFAVPAGTTTLYVMSNNTNLYAPITSFSASTTATSDSWTGQTMQLYVHAGTVYVNGTRVLWTGGSTPTVTAPSSHPRIDVLAIDSTGTLSWTTGSEASSPSAPSYPPNKVAICELYNVVGETALYDFENQQSAEGYIYNDVRPVAQYPLNPTSLSSSLIPSADATYDLGASGTEWNNGYFKNAIYVDGIPIGTGKFGGTGADGALSATSGATTVNCGGAAVVVKNYTSISLTGSASLAFTNPNTNGTVVIIRCQGNVTLTSSATPIINCSGMGAAGGTGGSSTSSTNVGGGVGTSGYGPLFQTNGGVGAVGGGSPAAGTGGAAISGIQANNLSQFLAKYTQLFVGGGGGGGGAYSTSAGGAAVVGGTGGNGGGGLVIECAGAWDFTTASGISVAGDTGGNGSGGNSNRGPGGGGGGGGGFCLVLYGTLTANSGTINVSGGTGGTDDPSTNGLTTYGGGGGASNVAGSAGSSSSTPNTVTGGTGAAGVSIVAANTEFA